MKKDEIVVEIRFFSKPGSSVRAFADVSLHMPEGSITVNGFSIIAKDGKAPFVGFPSKPGTVQGKFFPVVDLQGEIRNLICEAVIDAYEKEL